MTASILEARDISKCEGASCFISTAATALPPRILPMKSWTALCASSKKKATSSACHQLVIATSSLSLSSWKTCVRRRIEVSTLIIIVFPPSQEAAPQLTAEQTLFAQTDAKEAQFSHLQECLAKLQPTDRGLILEYYQGEKRTKIDHMLRLAQRLSLTMNALAIRACRIRTRLEACVKSSMGNS
jgi:hypothetical protein